MALPSSSSSAVRRYRRASQPGLPPEMLAAERADAFANWARRNVKLIVAGAAIALIGVGALVWRQVVIPQEAEQASVEFLQLQNTVESGNAQLAIRDLQSYVRRHSGTPYADEARLQLAQLQLDQGQAAAAITSLGDFGSSPGASPLAAQAGLLRATAQAAAGQREQAIASYMAVASGARLSYLQEQALASAAALHEQGGNFRGAATVYGQLVNLVERNSQDRSFYEMRRAEAEARARR